MRDDGGCQHRLGTQGSNHLRRRVVWQGVPRPRLINPEANQGTVHIFFLRKYFFTCAPARVVEPSTIVAGQGFPQ